MSKLILFSLGGSGERVMNSLVMLLSAGVRVKDNNGVDMSVKPIFLDTDVDSYALKDAKHKIDTYRALRGKYHDLTPFRDPQNTLFQTEIEEYSSITIDGQAMGNLYQLTQAANFDEGQKAELQMLFSGVEQNMCLREGFVGRPNIGSIALNYLLCNSGVVKNLPINENDKIFFVSSIFGGTGASGFPLTLNYIQDKANINVPQNTIAIGALTLLPYFKTSGERENAKTKIVVDVPAEDNQDKGTQVDVSVDSNEFEPKSYAAFLYYDKNLNKDRLSSHYFIGNNDVSEYPNAIGGDSQQNPSSLLEILAATAILHFANHSVARNQNNKTIKYYENWSGKENGYTYKLENIDDVDFGPEIRKSLVRILLFEYVVKSKIGDYTRDNHGTIADLYEFTLNDCETFKKGYEEFFEILDRWVDDLKDSAHNNSMKFLFKDSIDSYKNEDFLSEMSSIDEVSSTGFLRNPFRNRTQSENGWDSFKKEKFTHYLITNAIENIIKNKSF